MKAFFPQQEGGVLMFTALLLPVLLGILGLAIDVGNMQVTRRQEQAAADAAAYAGVRELFNQNSAGAATNAAQDSAAQNGFQDGVNNVTVTVNNPPKSGPNTGNNNAVEVIVSRQQPTFFMGIFGFAHMAVAARAVGSLGSSNVCIETTGPVGEGIDLDGGFILNAPTCSMMIDSTNVDNSTVGEQSLTTHGGNCQGGGGNPYSTPNGTTLVVAASLATAAQYYDQGVCYGNSFGTTNQTPNFGTRPLPDLLGYLQQPSNSSATKCDQYDASANNGKPLTISGPKNLQPGSYCGGIWLKPGADVTLQPGTYILNGGNKMGSNERVSLEVDGGARLKGSGVTFFNTGSTTEYPSHPSTGYQAWAPIVICSAKLAGPGPNCPTKTEADVNLDATTSPDYPGVLFFDARTLLDGTSPCWGSNYEHEQCAKKSNYTDSMIGGLNQKYAGTFYFPTTMLSFEGGPHTQTGDCSPFIGWILLWNIPGGFKTDGSGGGLTLNANCGGVVGGNALKEPVLGE